MKKLLWTLFILLLIALGFLYIVKNPELWISQTILKTVGLERLLVSNEEISMGTGTFTLDEIGATFTLPVGREIKTPPNKNGTKTKFVLSTPEKDNKWYQVIIWGSLQQSIYSGADILNLYNLQSIPQEGWTFTINCSGAFTQICMWVYENGNTYTIVFEWASNVPTQTNVLFSARVPRYEQIVNAMKNMIATVSIVPPVMTGNELTGSELTGASEKEFINTDFVNDWISVFYKWTKINVDANSFKLLNDIFFKDKKGIYTIAYIGDGEYALKKMDTINPSTFQIINDMFVKDDTKVYAVDSSNEATALRPLQVDINSSYVSSKFPEILSDKNNTTYYLNNKFTGISMQELENRITKHWTDFIIANNKVYINNTEKWRFNEYILLPDADPQTFKKSPEEDYHFQDKNHTYDRRGWIIK